MIANNTRKDNTVAVDKMVAIIRVLFFFHQITRIRTINRLIEYVKKKKRRKNVSNGRITPLKDLNLKKERKSSFTIGETSCYLKSAGVKLGSLFKPYSCWKDVGQNSNV